MLKVEELSEREVGAKAKPPSLTPKGREAKTAAAHYLQQEMLVIPKPATDPPASSCFRNAGINVYQKASELGDHGTSLL